MSGANPDGEGWKSNMRLDERPGAQNIVSESSFAEGETNFNSEHKAVVSTEQNSNVPESLP